MRWSVAAWSAAVVLASFAPFAGADEKPKPDAEKTEEKSSEGKKVFTKYKCRSCHAIESQGITKKAEEGEEEEKAEKAEKEKKPPDLSGVGLERKSDWIMLFLQKKEKLDGKLHTKKFRGTDAELKKLAAWLGTLKSDAAAKKEKAGGKTAEK